MLFDFSTQKWDEIAKITCGFPNWSKNSGFYNVWLSLAPTIHHFCFATPAPRKSTPSTRKPRKSRSPLPQEGITVAIRLVSSTINSPLQNVKSEQL
jgi:hypothetical protein